MAGSFKARAGLIAVLGLIAATTVAADPASAATGVGPWFGTASGPSARYGASMTYHPAAGVSVLFGGCETLTPTSLKVTLKDGQSRDISAKWCAEGDTQDDVWTWNGETNTWSPIQPLGPAPHARHLSSMTYDYVSESAVLFGGLYQTDAGDQPSASDAGACFGYGGGGIAGVQTVRDLNTASDHKYYCFKDTWALTFDAGVWAWTRLTTAATPPFRFDGGMASDADGRPNLVGGCHNMGMVGEKGSPYTPKYWDCNYYATSSYGVETFADVWRLQWTTNPVTGVSTPNWQQVGCTPPLVTYHPCAPPPTRGAAVSFDPSSDRVHVFGGYYYTPDISYNGFQGDTWLFDGLRWERASSQGQHDQFCPDRSPLTAWGAASHSFLDGKWQVHHYGGAGKYASPQANNGLCPTTRPLGVQAWSESWRYDDTDCVTLYNSSLSMNGRMCWWEEGHETPGPRFHASVAYDYVRGKLLLFGGLTCFGCSTPTAATHYYKTISTGPPNVVEICGSCL